MRKPNQTSIELLAHTFGMEIYDVLEIPRPDPDLHYLQTIWDDLTPEKRHSLRDKAEQYLTEDEAKRLHQKRRVSKA